MDSFNTILEGCFILMGFSNWPQLEHALFICISIFYFLTIFGNSTIITVSRMDPRLQTPMYFFLNNLSFLDLCYTTSTVPQLLVNVSGIDKNISYAGCMTQLFTVLLLGGTECVLLVVMAFDRYATVCHPLHYTSIMHPLLCQALAISSWMGGLVNSLTQTVLIMTTPLCGHHLNHFFCDMLVLLKLACEDTEKIEDNLFVAGAIILVCPVALILGTYVLIAHAVLRIKSMSGRRKALGTCGSHLMVVFLFYGLATPMLNPLIYTLRNKDMKGDSVQGTRERYKHKVGREQKFT